MIVIRIQSLPTGNDECTRAVMSSGLTEDTQEPPHYMSTLLLHPEWVEFLLYGQHAPHDARRKWHTSMLCFIRLRASS